MFRRSRVICFGIICALNFVSAVYAQPTGRDTAGSPLDPATRIRELTDQIGVLMGALSSTARAQLSSEILSPPRGLTPSLRGSSSPREEATIQRVRTLKEEIDALIVRLSPDLQTQLRQALAAIVLQRDGTQPSPPGNRLMNTPAETKLPSAPMTPSAPLPPSNPRVPAVGPLPDSRSPRTGTPDRTSVPQTPPATQNPPAQPPPLPPQAPHAIALAGGVSRIEAISVSDTSPTTTLTVSIARIPKALLQWIREAIATNGAATRTGEFRIYFPNAPTAAVRSFQGATIARVIFPATMAGVVHHHGDLTVDINPGLVNNSTMDTQGAPKFPTELKGLPGFVFMPGPPLPSVDMISKIDALTWETQGGAPTLSAIVLTLPVQAMETWVNVLQQSEQQVGVGAITSGQGQFTYLVGSNPALSLALSNLTIASLVPPSLEDGDQSTFRLLFSAASVMVE